MASNNAPYYTTSSQTLDPTLASRDSNDGSMYPDLAQATASSAQMYSLADGALQVHQNNANSHFAGLIEAATAAAGQEDEYGQATESARPRRITRQSSAHEDTSSDPLGPANGTTARSIGDAIQDHPDGQQRSASEAPPFPSTRKRKRTSEASPQGRGSTSRGYRQADEDDHSTLEIRELPPQSSISNARAAGVHSAAALFRRPSASSKKYTRPPMAKMFASLELSPEDFLHLQAAAKGYMLDRAHPERRDCVGQRGKGDSELVKLRLWNCVKDFLEMEGHGGKYFSAEVPGDEGMQRTMIWPRDENKIITAVTPLLRRMVTNERQRQYAVVTRKGGGTDSDGTNKRRKLDDVQAPPPQVHQQEQGYQHQEEFPQSRNIGLGLPELQDKLLEALPNDTEGRLNIPTEAPGQTMARLPSSTPGDPSSHSNALQLHINILQDHQRILPRLVIPAEQCPDMQTLYSRLLEQGHTAGPDPLRISVLLPGGLTPVQSDGEWMVALTSAKAVDWLDGELKVVVEV
ncbi:hypothetical protein LPUS_03201 [Lasallia pustulata]|uniref:Uncharacterized protein n=1 Tax=Lasallia pustulata TaxID=136370 RepID=A0A1W5CUC2_9LECA|nr:hypothetical protein LPUS_03201 [Lasallia pustulata]